VSDPEQEARERVAADLEALQKLVGGGPQPREPLPDQPELGLPGLPIYTARAPRPQKPKAKPGKKKG
jgi:hypothetical protein